MSHLESISTRRMSLLRRLVESDGISGAEEKIRVIMREEMEGLCEEIAVDGIGNLIGTKNPNTAAPKIMLASHMDEVGLIVKYIRPDGYIGFEPNGFIDTSILPSQWVRISTRKGVVHGVIGTKAGHFAENSKDVQQPLLIDVAARSREEVVALGVRAGDFAAYDRPLRISDNGKYFQAKALDNRIGCTVMIESIRELAAANPSCRIYAVGTVMEEVGGIGARVAANNLQPQVALVLDGTPASDPYVSLEQSAVQVAHGPVIRRAEIRIPDSNVTPRWLADLAVKTAEADGIPYQIDVTSTIFSDASAINISGKGIPTIPILVPRQNSHSPAEIASIEDTDNAIRLTVALVKALSSAALLE